MAAAYSKQIGVQNTRLRDAQLGKTQPVYYKARDGLDISGYLTLPPNLAGGSKPPLIVYVHGGPEMRAREEFNPVVQFLATRGYAVFQPNFRGSSGYGRAFADAGKRQFGKAMQTDVADGVQYVAGLGAADTSRMCIMGESYGGYAALMGVIQFPGLYQCAISASGPTDLFRFVKWEREEEGSDSESYQYWVKQMGDPKRDEAEMKAISPVNNVAAIKAPVMLIHGTRDDTVPYEQAELMQKALQVAGKDMTFVELRNEGHSPGPVGLQTYLRSVETFLNRHLPAAPVPASTTAAITAQ
jgi:dipeptidyl aminopeptidase/acylaminoacyl peptidase